MSTYSSSHSCRITKAKLRQGSARSRESSVEQFRSAHDDHAAIAGKLEVRGNDAGVDLSNELARRVPDVHSVAAAGVNVSLGVAVNTYNSASSVICYLPQLPAIYAGFGQKGAQLTIGSSGVDVCKGLAVLPRAVRLDIVSIAAEENQTRGSREYTEDVKYCRTYMDAGWVRFMPKSARLIPVSVTYA